MISGLATGIGYLLGVGVGLLGKPLLTVPPPGLGTSVPNVLARRAYRHFGAMVGHVTLSAGKEVVMKVVRLWLGLVLLTLGVFGILDAAGVLEVGSTIGRWWPLAVIGLGLSAMWSQRRISIVPIVITVTGVVLLAGTLDWTDEDLFWPALLFVSGSVVLAGLFRRRGGGRPARGESVALFGGAKTVDRSEHLRHADVSAVFGGATLDLRAAHIDKEASVDALALFGGVDVLVPKDWRVEVSGFPVLGGLDDKTRGNGSLPEDAPVLKVNATALFGGIEVANEPK
ncbi:LiaF transmembrane domain-containing protein [Qaidamihabitans albus]|uniref:LiaF transmembrane domain-containing protein n=1 Tax=Qaidamihabitans albus TaxID=2795733 RepID=UPI003557DBF6